MNYGALYKVNKLRSVWPVERSLRSLVNPERRISDQSDGKIVLEFCAEINLLKFRWLYHCSRKSTFFIKPISLISCFIVYLSNIGQCQLEINMKPLQGVFINGLF